jgi:DNA (cytosine-5)-methyltransferase 1
LWSEHHDRVLKASPTDLQYVVHELLFEAADFGLPQTRRRVILVGIRSDVAGAEDWTPPETTHSRDALLYDQWVTWDYWSEYGDSMPELPDGLQVRVRDLKENGRPDCDRWQTIRDCIRDLPAPIDRTPAESATNHEGIPGARAYAKHSGSPLDWPAKTIKAGVHGVSGGEAMIRFDDGSLRYFTVRESARMQGFPDEYEFPVARSRAMGAIGNAVAVPVAETLTRAIVGLLGSGQS